MSQVKHANIDKAREVFYDYSFHEMGVYDQPALWKLVMEITKQDKLSYIGHS